MPCTLQIGKPCSDQSSSRHSITPTLPTSNWAPPRDSDRQNTPDPTTSADHASGFILHEALPLMTRLAHSGRFSRATTSLPSAAHVSRPGSHPTADLARLRIGRAPPTWRLTRRSPEHSAAKNAGAPPGGVLVGGMMQSANRRQRGAGQDEAAAVFGAAPHPSSPRRRRSAVVRGWGRGCRSWPQWAARPASYRPPNLASG
jgi:hypothetical protein